MRCLLIVLIYWCAPLLTPAVEVEATVVRIVDGDTIIVSPVAGLHLSTRLLWIDTPESRGRNEMPEGHAASQAMAAMLPIGSQVVLWGPGEVLQTDRWGRLLAVVFHREVDSEGVEHLYNINLNMIMTGWAPYWRKYGQHPDEEQHRIWTAAMQRAKEAGRGAWETASKWMTDKANETTAPGR